MTAAPTINEPSGAAVEGPGGSQETSWLRPKGPVLDVLIPLASVAAALVAGGVLMQLQGVAAGSAYGEVLTGALGSTRALRNTSTAATPLVLLALGVALAYRAKLFTIGSEGQFVVGGLAALAWATSGLADGLPAALLVGTAAIAGMAGGAVWSGLSAVMLNRFKASVVITSILLNYLAIALLTWAVRVGVRNDESFTPKSLPIGDAALPDIGGSGPHAGVVVALLAVPVVAVALNRTRFGLRIAVMGSSPGVLRTNEVSTGRMTLGVLACAGALAGLAGYVQVAGVATTMTPAFSTGLGFTAIMVALLGRLHPVGALMAAVAMAAISVGFDSAARVFTIPSSTSTVVQVLIVFFFVIGETLAHRRRR
ncbi:ABC transporter permease [Phytoactinopolyspora endophytica]|uniref:ABC transporter permease n=1 Tax=Phytoactinopolyspora endophytica TaxID=1642495 RepID=UPI00101D55E1|nr:ABC transporter permease [Phytoactinopolyspora endophytica]